MKEFKDSEVRLSPPSPQIHTRHSQNGKKYPDLQYIKKQFN